MNLSVFPLVLQRWPCNCIVPCGDGKLATWRVCYECPWCDAVVSRPDLIRWFEEAEPQPMTMTPSHPLLRGADGEIVEVVGQCSGCGGPEVRAREWRAKRVHLCLPMRDDVEILRD